MDRTTNACYGNVGGVSDEWVGRGLVIYDWLNSLFKNTNHIQNELLWQTHKYFQIITALK